MNLVDENTHRRPAGDGSSVICYQDKFQKESLIRSEFILILSLFFCLTQDNIGRQTSLNKGYGRIDAKGLFNNTLQIFHS